MPMCLRGGLNNKALLYINMSHLIHKKVSYETATVEYFKHIAIE